MVDYTPIILTVIAMAIYLINLFFLYFILKRTRNTFKQTMVYLFIAIFILFIRRILNLLNLASLYNAEILDDCFAIIVASFFLISAVTLFRDIHQMTDVDVNKTKAARLPPPRRALERYRNERHEQSQRFKPEKREPEKSNVGLSASDLVKRK